MRGWRLVGCARESVSFCPAKAKSLASASRASERSNKHEHRTTAPYYIVVCNRLLAEKLHSTVRVGCELEGTRWTRAKQKQRQNKTTEGSEMTAVRGKFQAPCAVSLVSLLPGKDGDGTCLVLA